MQMLQGPSARTLVVLLTAIGLSLGYGLAGRLVGLLYPLPQTFTISKFWSYLKPWLTTTDHKEVGILYFLFGFTFFLVGGVLALFVPYSTRFTREHILDRD